MEESLPVEIKDKIFGFMSSAFLEDVISLVCQQWAKISSKILECRIEKMLSSSAINLNQIRNRIHPSIQNNNKMLLREFEKSFLKINFNITVNPMTELVVQDLIMNSWRTRKCDCLYSFPQCTSRVIHLMPCHQLILVQVPCRIKFFPMSIVQYCKNASNKFGNKDMEYEVTVQGSNYTDNIKIDDNTHTAVSVYKDLIVSQETTRALILFRVVHVDHILKKVTLENVRRIFLPLWSCDLMMLEDKVCALFTTGTVGLWTRSKDEISISENKCGRTEIIRAMQFSKMYSVNHLILVKIVADLQSGIWTIFDSNLTTEGFKMHSISLKNLVQFGFMKQNETCFEVFDIFVVTNAIMIHCRVQDGSSICLNKLLVKRLKKSPELEDFLDQARFSNLFCDTNVAEQSVTINGCIILPFFQCLTNSRTNSCEAEYHHFVRFLGLKNGTEGLHEINLFSIDIENS